MGNKLTPESEFSKLREKVFPIHNEELKYFIPMVVMIMCILFNYSVLRSTKDALIATADASGVEAIPYLKSIFVMVTAAIFVVIYTKIANFISFEKIYYGFSIGFIIYFLAFAFLIYPNREFLHPNLSNIEYWQSEYPGLKFLFSVWGVWTYSMFYVIAEMWGNIMIPVIFWQFANQTINTTQAKRFYPMFILFGNVALVFSGSSIQYFSSIFDKSLSSTDNWGESIKGLMVFISLMAVISILAFRWANLNVFNSCLSDSERVTSVKKEKKLTMGLVESFRYILSNRYIGLIALLIFSYSVSINIVELVWKKQIAVWYAHDAQGYSMFMGRYVTWTGIATIIIAYTTKNVISRYGWLTGAMSTPVVLVTCGLVFFSLILSGDLLIPLLTLISLPATYMAMEVGLFQSIFTRGVKYTLFDASKEMTYIPLDPELKAKGKAVVGVLGARLGKTFSSWLVLILFYLLAVEDIMQILPFLVMFLAAVIVIWISSVLGLNRLYQRKTLDEYNDLKDPKQDDPLHTKKSLKKVLVR